MNKIRTVVVDDDPFVRMSLQTILDAQDDIEICALGGSGEEAVDLYERERPDVLLMDIQMPGMGGLDAAELILGTHDDARIVFLTTFSDDEYIVRALRIGAKGYLVKQEVATIAPALRAVVAGQNVLGTEVLDRMDALMRAGTMPSSAPATPSAAPSLRLSPEASRALRAGGGFRREEKEGLHGAGNRRADLQGDAMTGTPASGQASSQELTERERAIVELVAEGLDNKEIAARLYLSEGTVRNHISAILQKLDLKNRTQLVVRYYRDR